MTDPIIPPAKWINTFTKPAKPKEYSMVDPQEIIRSQVELEHLKQTVRELTAAVGRLTQERDEAIEAAQRQHDEAVNQVARCGAAELERDVLAEIIEQLDYEYLGIDFMVNGVCIESFSRSPVTWNLDDRPTTYPTAIEAIRAAMKGADDGT